MNFELENDCSVMLRDGEFFDASYIAVKQLTFLSIAASLKRIADAMTTGSLVAESENDLS